MFPGFGLSNKYEGTKVDRRFFVMEKNFPINENVFPGS